MMKAVVGRAVVSAVLLAGLLGVLSCRGNDSGKREPVRIRALYGEGSALISIAADRHFFAGNGLDVTLTYHTSPAGALESLMQGELDFTQASEFAVAGQALQRKPINVIASIMKTVTYTMVGRQDRGIVTAADLKGRRIGLTCGSTAEFYLGRCLEQHGLEVQEVTRIDLPPSRLVEAIADGSIDAAMVRRSDVRRIQERLADGAAAWPAQGNLPVSVLVVCRSDWIARHPDLVKRVLRALVQAEAYLGRHPQEARAIAQEHRGPDADNPDSVWPYSDFSLSLDLSLVIALTDQARWMIANRLSDAETAPDFQDYIYCDGLRAVKPEAVNLVPLK